MTAKRSASPPRNHDLAAYNRLVGSVQPIAIRLVSVRFNADPYPGGTADAKVTERAPRWEPSEPGFTAFQPLTITGSATGDSGVAAALSLELEFAIEYQSREPMTDAFFEIFGQANLPINVRPFLREAVVNFVMRSGWPPLILPAFLRPSRTELAAPTPRRRRVRPKQE